MFCASLLGSWLIDMVCVLYFNDLKLSKIFRSLKVYIGSDEFESSDILFRDSELHRALLTVERKCAKVEVALEVRVVGPPVDDRVLGAVKDLVGAGKCVVGWEPVTFAFHGQKGLFVND